MKIPLIDVKISDPNMRTEIGSTLSRLIDSTSFIGGEEVNKFSEEFAESCGGGYCAPVGNGTDALILALRALKVGPGDEVITVPYTFIATTEAISVVGATIRFVDIHPKSYNMDVSLLEKAITKKTKAIIPVHLYGQPCDMDPIMDLAKKHKLKVIEDAAQAHGAEYKGRRVGTLGDAGCFSFYPTKNLGGFGDGGAVVSQSKELIEKVNQLANHGRSEHYYHEVEGINSRLDSFQAAVLRIKLRKLDEWTDRRRAIAEQYTKALVQNSFITPPHIESYAKHVFHLFCVESPSRDELMRHLKSKGISCGVYYPLPLHLQPAYAHLGYKKGDFLISERLIERILSIPVSPSLTDTQVEYVCSALHQFSPKTLIK